MTTYEADTDDQGFFLGLDCSTQSMSAVLVDRKGRVLHECGFRFDETFPHYGTENGVIRVTTESTDTSHQPQEQVLIPSMMIVEALDAILSKLSTSATSKGFTLADVKGVSGSAQQHGSVFWAKDLSLRERLDAADTNVSLKEALGMQAFALENGASWMDSSTTVYCKELEQAVGGPERLAEISGSRAYERFTGNQIAKRIHDDPFFLDKVERIALLSSMLTSLLCGNYTPIDESDGSGMNLLDVRSRRWSTPLLEATVKRSSTPDAAYRLKDLLGEKVIRSYDEVGVIHPYFQKKYGFSSTCKVIPFSGDNPCTLAGIGLSHVGDIGISLGTSSTLMAVVPSAEARLGGTDGHFFRNPVDPESLMAMICFKNGSLTRQGVRDRRANGSWDEFNSMLKATKVGNDGITGFYFDDPEITPSTTNAGIIGFDATASPLNMNEAPAEVEVRAVVESQFLAMRLHAERLGAPQPQRLIVVGGAAANTCLLQVLANVFNAPTYRLIGVDNSAALGGALRAHHGFACATSAPLVGSYVPFDVTSSLDLSLAANPEKDAATIYTANLPYFQALETKAAKMLA